MAQKLVQAQIEQFADSNYVKKFSDDQEALLKNSRRLAQVESFPELPDGFPDDLAGLVQKYKGDYLSFLSGQTDSGVLDEAVEYSRLYDQRFRSKVAGIGHLLESKKPKEIPGYLGSGGNGSAFTVETDGTTYAVKFSTFSRQTQLNFELKPLRRGRGIAHLAQLITYSFEDKAVVMELLPGKNVTEFDSITRPDYTDEEIISLIETVVEMDRNGLLLDSKASNFMYDKEQGFSILDYHINDTGCSIAGSAISLIDALTYDKDKYEEKWGELFKSDRDSFNVLAYEDELQELRMTSRVLHILQDHFPDIFAEALVKNQERKDDARSSSYGKGYFYRDDIMERMSEEAASFEDTQQRIDAVKAILADIGSLGFF